MSASSGMPYYSTVTRVRDTQDISLVTLPAGTILFRGIKLPTENPLAFYTDYLGTPSTVDGAPTLCLKPTHNVFFYAQPLVSFGAHGVGSTFDAMQVVVLVKDVNVICMIRPSSMVRGEGKRYSGDAPIQRCSNFKESCGDLTEEDVQRLAYDNCLSPAYQRRSFTRGWMAIANLDSIDPDISEDSELEHTMAKYLQGLEKRQPGVGSLLTASTYVDATRTEKGKVPRTGFPEIVLYPYATPPSDVSLHQPCSSDTMAMALLAKQAKKDNLLYLPVATITAKGIVDMIGGHFSFDRIKTGGDQVTLEGNVTRYLNSSMKYGVRLPFYGNGTISFDTRTGFYILPQVATSAYRVNIIPMDTTKQARRKDVIDASRKYLVTCRTYSPDTYKKEVPLPTGNISNAFIFARPLLLAPVFKAVKIALPKDMYEYLKEASEAYKASRPLTIKAPTQAPVAGPLPIGAQSPAYVPKTPIGAQSPAYVPTTPIGAQSPAYAPTTPIGAQSPAYAPTTPIGAQSPAYAPTTPIGAQSPAQNPISNKASKAIQDIRDGKETLQSILGGYGKPINPYGLTPKEVANVQRLVGGVRSTYRKRGARQTRKNSKNPLKRYAEHFSKLWKVFAKKKISK